MSKILSTWFVHAHKCCNSQKEGFSYFILKENITINDFFIQKSIYFAKTHSLLCEGLLFLVTPAGTWFPGARDFELNKVLQILQASKKIDTLFSHNTKAKHYTFFFLETKKNILIKKKVVLHTIKKSLTTRLTNK